MNVCDVERMARRRMDVLLFVSLLRVSEFWSVMKCAFGHRTQKNSAQKISCWKQGCSRHAKFKQVIIHFGSTLVCDKLHTRLWHLQINFLEQTHVCLGYFFRNQGTHVTMWLTLPGCAQHIILCKFIFWFLQSLWWIQTQKKPRCLWPPWHWWCLPALGCENKMPWCADFVHDISDIRTWFTFKIIPE